MRILPFVLTATMMAGSALAHDAERSFDFDRLGAGVTRVVLEVGVGDVEVIADSADRITAHVEVSASKGWRSAARAQRELDALQLESELRGDVLHLHLSENGDGDHKCGEDWWLHLPPHIAVEIEQGVGDLRILDLAADIDVELGVGDVRIEGEHAAFGRISGQCGVGDVSLRSPKGREEGNGFIAHSLSSTGPGKASIEVEAGVGDVEIRLR